MLAEMYYPEIIVSPCILQEYFDNKKCDCMVVTVEGDEYLMCEKRSLEKFWSKSKSGNYAKGLANTDADPAIVERTGNLGQMAAGKLLGVEVDMLYRHGGDKQDFMIGKHRADIKNATYRRDSGLIYCINEFGRKVPVEKDIYVFSYTKLDDRKNKKAEIVVVGFALLQDVLESPIKKGYKGKGHYNYEVAFSSLRPISKLREAKLKYFNSP